MKIAIDGPSGSGKSTVAKALAKRTGFSYLDTGAMYRGITYYLLKNNISLTDQERIEPLLQNVSFSFKEGLLYLNGENVEKEIRKNEVSRYVSTVAALPYVREALVDMQRKVGNEEENVILDGRDIGTVVYPDAEVKIFLVATLEERTRRRQLELKERGEEVEFEKLKEEMALRDKKDSTRKVGPLKKAKDAIEIVTDSLSVEEIVDKITRIIENR